MAVRNQNAAVKSNYDYVHGNAAPAYRTNAVPSPRELERRRQEEQRRREEEERIKEENKHKAREYRERERALSYSRAYVFFFSVCIGVMFLVCGCFLYLQNSMTTHLNNIASIESQIIDLRSENDETEQLLESSADLDAIKDKAMNELGMTYPDSSQIIYYNVNESDTMTQYAEVP